MKKLSIVALFIIVSSASFAQKISTVYLDPKDSTANMYVAVEPANGPVKALLFLMDGFGARPADVLVQTDLPKKAATHGILTIIPVLQTGPLYFGSDDASQQALGLLAQRIITTRHLEGKDFYIGGFSIGGTCAVKYAEEAAKGKYPIKPKAVFALDPPLDWQRVYNSAKRMVRLSDPAKLNGEVSYLIGRIEKEMHGTPTAEIEHYYNQSPYSFSDTTQRAVKTLIHTPVMLITEPDIQWWISQRGFDLSYLNVFDAAAMITELQKLGNRQSVLVTTMDKGYRAPMHIRHPHSWSIADSSMVVKWLMEN